MKDKVVVITGGSSGIGKALAYQFAQSGSKVVVSGRDMIKLMELEKEFSTKNLTIITVVAEVTSETDAQILINRAIKDFGKIDILINNAGISMRALFESCEVDVIKKLMDVNFMGTVLTTKAALPYIISSKGSIVGISSIAGYKGLPGRTGYSASKFAMQGFFESLRIELLKKNVHVLVACPGFTASNIRNTALGADGKSQKESPLDEQKIMSAETVAKCIYDAILNRKRDLILTQQGKLTVLLNKFFPSWIDKKVFQHFASEKDSPLK